MKINYIKFMIIFLILFIINMNFCYAANYKATITGSDVALRSGPGTNHSKIKTLVKHGEYDMVDNNKYESTGGCSNGWYKIYYEASSSGYVCSDYVSISSVANGDNPSGSCEQNLQAAGFPSSYWPGLCSLQSSHPNWQFKPIYTGLDWSTAVNNESSCGKSYIASSDPSNIDSTCKNAYTKTWYPASSSAVAYYMDPRNWFTEQYIFQFEYLKYDNGLANVYASAASDIIDHAEFYKYHLNLGNNLGSIINTVGSQSNVSPIFIASRILQELGSSNSLYNLYSGVYAGYEGYYNFYNFGVNDSCATTSGTTICGLSYAKSNDWYGLSAAIKGGADQIASGYINKGQYTTYLQKYNVSPTEASKLYGHQYMTNIAAPSSEGKTTYNTYKDLGLLNNVFAFYIPVYNNMNNTNYSQNNGAVDIPDEDNPSSLGISTIVVSAGYKYASGQITGISPSTNVSSLKSALESISGSGKVVIKNSKGNEVTDGLVGTGYQIVVSNNNTSETMTAIINGDTSGDGLVNALDLLQVQKKILGTYTLSGVYNLAGDTSDDGQINALDLLQIQKSILGTYTIEQ